MLINKFDFELVGSPDDVGMKTGATIHTMNGLNMIVKKASEDDKKPKEEWWVMQHLRRGLNTNGRPYSSEEDAAWETSSKAKQDSTMQP
mmetsp:Transcript_22986/g.34575  ORF Transcript_22986/g.34575 Transcript_22986/m.34575 type:complete len:89 (+) Transcript_22986:64-330(+)|eukprot:619328-Ditylum_brightwellii.AAC.1